MGPLLLVHKQCAEHVASENVYLTMNSVHVSRCRVKLRCRKDEVPFNMSAPGSLPGADPRTECLPIAVTPSFNTSSRGFEKLSTSTVLPTPDISKIKNAPIRGHFFNPSEIQTTSGKVTVYRLSNATRCRMLSRKGNYALDVMGEKYVSTMCACWHRDDNCEVLAVADSDNTASGKGVFAHFTTDGAFAGAEDPRIFVFDDETYVLFNAPTMITIAATGAHIKARKMFISRLADTELRATSIITIDSLDAEISKNFVPIVTENTVFLVISIEPFDLCELSFHVATFGTCKRNRKYIKNYSRETYANSIHGGSNTVATESGHLAVAHYFTHGIFGRLYIHKFVLFSNFFPHQPTWFSRPFLVHSSDPEFNGDITFVSGLKQGAHADEFILLYGAADCSSYQVKVRLDLTMRDDIPAVALPEQEHLTSLTVQWEGPLHDHSSFSMVANELFADAHFTNDRDDFRWRFINTDGANLITSDALSVNSKSLFKAVARKTLDLWPEPALTVRMTWPLMLHKPASGRVAHYFPWEFNVLPREVSSQHLDEVWVTSESVRQTMLRSGIQDHRIFILQHGVSQIYCDAFKSRSQKRRGAGTFVFLFHGGGLFRKGFDLIIPSFIAAFTPEDDVLLLVHASYAAKAARDTFHKQLKKVSVAFRNKIEVNENDLSHDEILAMFQRADVLLQPSRAEGFGLGVLQGMAIGVPAIIPRYGGFLDFTTEESSYIFDVTLERCNLPPCDKHGSRMWGKLFHAPYGERFRWARIRKKQLAKAMQRAYHDRHDGLLRRSAHGHSTACDGTHSWKHVYEKMCVHVRKIIASRDYY